MTFSKKPLHPVNSGAYTFPVVKTMVTEIGVSKLRLADNRLPAVFFRPLPCARLQWPGLGGGALAHAGSQSRRYANPVLCPATSIGVEARVSTPRLEATMPKALARPEQSRFLLAVSAGRHAADLWLQSPQMSLCDWRDNRFAAHACGMGFTDLAERRTAFNEAFAQVIAEAVIGVVIVAVEVCHG
ncbi:hypothetical protein [Ralstonia solanacearum]|uniref:hypothetical protein n=1 Tax=Ralstonia solanacearum TaxID=305 RepID=UPI001E59C18A|nr:hypothetical protein [Ralstonia solanacearum]